MADAVPEILWRLRRQRGSSDELIVSTNVTFQSTYVRDIANVYFVVQSRVKVRDGDFMIRRLDGSGITVRLYRDLEKMGYLVDVKFAVSVPFELERCGIDVDFFGPFYVLRRDHVRGNDGSEVPIECSLLRANHDSVAKWESSSEAREHTTFFPSVIFQSRVPSFIA